MSELVRLLLQSLLLGLSVARKYGSGLLTLMLQK